MVNLDIHYQQAIPISGSQAGPFCNVESLFEFAPDSYRFFASERALAQDATGMSARTALGSRLVLLCPQAVLLRPPRTGGLTVLLRRASQLRPRNHAWPVMSLAPFLRFPSLRCGQALSPCAFGIASQPSAPPFGSSCMRVSFYTVADAGFMQHRAYFGARKSRSCRHPGAPRTPSGILVWRWAGAHHQAETPATDTPELRTKIVRSAGPRGRSWNSYAR